MNLPTMTNEQFALWFAAGQGASKLYDNAETVYNWLESKSKKPSDETLTMTVPLSEDVYQLAKNLHDKNPYKPKKK